MHALLRPLLTLLLLPTLISPTPILPHSDPSSAYCANAPSTIAGTHLARRHLPPLRSLLPPRVTNPSDPLTWCAHSSRTYLTLTFARLFPGPSYPDLLARVSSAIAAHIAQDGDGVVAGGGVDIAGADGALGIEMRIVSAAGRRLTWGVVGAAVGALRDFGAREGFGAVFFRVWDGKNEVGEGAVR